MKWENYPDYPDGPNLITRVFIRESKKVKVKTRWAGKAEAGVLLLKMEEGTTCQGIWVFLETVKVKEMDSPQNLQKECSPAYTLILGHISEF